MVFCDQMQERNTEELGSKSILVFHCSERRSGQKLSCHKAVCQVIHTTYTMDDQINTTTEPEILVEILVVESKITIAIVLILRLHRQNARLPTLPCSGKLSREKTFVDW